MRSGSAGRWVRFVRGSALGAGILRAYAHLPDAPELPGRRMAIRPCAVVLPTGWDDEPEFDSVLVELLPGGTFRRVDVHLPRIAADVRESTVHEGTAVHSAAVDVQQVEDDDPAPKVCRARANSDPFVDARTDVFGATADNDVAASIGAKLCFVPGFVARRLGTALKREAAPDVRRCHAERGVDLGDLLLRQVSGTRPGGLLQVVDHVGEPPGGPAGEDVLP